MSWHLSVKLDMVDKYWKLSPNCKLVLFSYCCLVLAEQLRAPDSSSGVSDQQSVGLSPDRGPCALEQDTLPWLLCPLDRTLSQRSCVLGLVTLINEEKEWTLMCLNHIASILVSRFLQGCVHYVFILCYLLNDKLFSIVSLKMWKFSISCLLCTWKRFTEIIKLIFICLPQVTVLYDNSLSTGIMFGFFTFVVCVHISENELT